MGSLEKTPKRGEPCLAARRPDQRRQEQTPETRAPRSAACWSKGGKGPPARARPSRRRSAVKPGWREHECRRKERGSLLHWKENSMHGSVLARANVHSAVNCVTLGERAVGSPPNTSHLQDRPRQRRRTAACTSSNMLTMESMRISWYRTALSNTEES